MQGDHQNQVTSVIVGAYLGPVVNAKSLENLEGIARRSVKEGGELLTCGERIEGRRGYFYRPTILAKVTTSMEVL